MQDLLAKKEQTQHGASFDGDGYLERKKPHVLSLVSALLDILHEKANGL